MIDRLTSRIRSFARSWRALRKNPANEQRIAICIYDYPWTVSPSILNSAQLLAEAGYTVDMFVHRWPAEPYAPAHENISLTAYRDEPSASTAPSLPEPLPGPRNLLRRKLPQQWYQWAKAPRRLLWISWYEYLWFREVADYASWLRSRLSARVYQAAIGIDAYGTIAAVWATRGTSLPVAYYSLEIHLSGDEHSFRFRTMKRFDRWAHQRVAFTIIQDRERAMHLAHDNRVSADDFVLVPVAALGDVVTESSAYLQERLDIPRHKTLILSAGGIAHYNLCLELAQAALSWPDEWVLVIHGYAPDPTYLESIRPYCGNGKVFLSTELVPYQDLDALLASGAIGVALYKNLNPNFENIVLSSGKLAQYLKVGLPVVATDFPGVKQLMANEQCGIAVRDAGEVQPAIAKILASYAEYRTAAYATYRQYYDMRSHFGRVIQRLNSLQAGRS